MGLCLHSVELLEEAQLPIRAADQPGVLQAQPGSGNRCQALAETRCQACALTILQGHLISNGGQRQSSTEVLEKHRNVSRLKMGGGVCLFACPTSSVHMSSVLPVHVGLLRAPAWLWICAEADFCTPLLGLWAHLRRKGNILIFRDPGLFVPLVFATEKKWL